MINKKVKELKLDMPPTRESLGNIFKGLNLNVPTVRLIECLLFCRGIKLENSDPEEFEIDKLYKWVDLNLKSMPHINTKGVHPEWLSMRQSTAGGHQRTNTLPLPPLKPDPNFFLRKGMGNGAAMTNRILLMSQNFNASQSTAPTAFEKYGMSANQMAVAFDSKH